MKKHVLGRIAMAGLATLATFAVVAACTRPKGPEQKADWATAMLSKKLDLNEDQRGKLDAVKTEVLGIMKAHQADRAKNFEEIKQLVLSERLDPARVKALMAERQKLIDENYDRVFAKVSDFHASLKPEQKKEAVEMMEKFAEHMN